MDQQKRVELELTLEDRLRAGLGELTVRPYAYYKEGAMQRMTARSSVGRAISFVGAGAALTVALVLALGVAPALLNLRGPGPVANPAAASASSVPTASPTPATTSSSPTTPTPITSPSTGDTPPPPNRLDVKIIDALARLGVTGQRAQPSPGEDSNIWARLTTGSELFVSALPTGTGRGEFTVISERQLAGIRVQRVQYASSPELRHRFACAADTFEVRGAVPPGFADMDAFVTAFIRSLGCGTQ